MAEILNFPCRARARLIARQRKDNSGETSGFARQMELRAKFYRDPSLTYKKD